MPGPQALTESASLIPNRSSAEPEIAEALALVRLFLAIKSPDDRSRLLLMAEQLIAQTYK